MHVLLRAHTVVSQSSRDRDALRMPSILRVPVGIIGASAFCAGDILSRAWPEVGSSAILVMDSQKVSGTQWKCFESDIWNVAAVRRSRAQQHS